ncbi:LamG-like jellyroll fold domain-containing protein [Streptomyces sp. NPDC050439]|uniref:LamG-like jellyroll fold domain-containing protein n=1 Tax=unclassified Streptomyces TaxID=2593676 RepID=UPI0034367EA5
MIRHAFVHSAVAVALASSAVVATPWAAAAADNRPPDQPALSELMTGGKKCASGTERPYVRTRPQLSAVLRDPDAQPVSAEFEVSWRDAAGERQVRTAATTSRRSGSEVRWSVPEDVPAATDVDWRVRAFDGTAWGPWSSDGDRGTCGFVYDIEEPAKPSVSSPEYPDDTESWHDGVGAYGTFTVDSSSDDTVSYVYRFAAEKQQTAEPKEPGGPVELRWMPKSSGLQQLSVQAIDRAGNASEPVNYQFRVASGRTPVAGWKLADPAGSVRADASAGGRPAEAVGSVTFGAEGPSRTDVKSAVELDGSGGGHLTSGAPAVDAGEAFAVSAWVRPGEAGRDMTAVSQGGDDGPAFALGADAEGNWSFSLGGGTSVRAEGGLPESGEWAHLTGVYDPVERAALLYVNGRLVGTAESASAPGGSGALQIGRSWDGRIADVQVWDRVVVPAEAAALGKRATVREGHWQFDESAAGASPEHDGRQSMKLGGDARIQRDDSDCGLDPDCVPGETPMVGEGQLKLDGEGDHAATDGPVVDTGDSFSLAAHVQLDPAAEGRTMTVLSLPGEQTDVAALRYTPEQQSWELTLAHEDRAGAETTKLTADNDWASSGQPHHLAVVYDDGADEVLLYVDGHLSAKAPFHHSPPATGGLQVGRAAQADGGSEYLHGAVDDVQAYAGALSERQVVVLSGGGTSV